MILNIVKNNVYKKSIDFIYNNGLDEFLNNK